jgi:hypothetical protein
MSTIFMTWSGHLSSNTGLGPKPLDSGVSHSTCSCIRQKDRIGLCRKTSFSMLGGTKAVTDGM